MNMRIIIRAAVAVVVLAMLFATVAQAGGWAVITLDDLPRQIVAKQPFTIGFTVRQHGRTFRAARGRLRPLRGQCDFSE
jgi:ABC-type sugar transport system substrate-binding protein